MWLVLYYITGAARWVPGYLIAVVQTVHIRAKSVIEKKISE